MKDRVLGGSFTRKKGAVMCGRCVGSSLKLVAASLLFVLAAAGFAAAQITTGTVSGNVKDPQGGVIPGATVVLISETRGTKSAPAVTNETGDYVFPNVTPDTYTVEVTLEAFKTVKRAGIAVSGGDRVGDSAAHARTGCASPKP